MRQLQIINGIKEESEVSIEEADELFEKKCNKAMRQIKSDYAAKIGLNIREKTYSSLLNRITKIQTNPHAPKINQIFGKWEYYIQRTDGHSFLIWKKAEGHESIMIVTESKKDYQELCRGFKATRSNAYRRMFGKEPVNATDI